MQGQIGSQLQAVWAEIVAYLPSLLGAIGILLLGWIVARIVGGLVRRAFARSRLDDRVVGWVRGDEESADLDVSGAAGKTAFWIVFLFVLVAFFEALNLTIVTEPLNALLSQFAGYLPRLIGGAAVFVVAALLAFVVRRVVHAVVEKSSLEQRLRGSLDVSAVEPDGAPTLAATLSEAGYWLTWLLFLPGILAALAVEGLLEPVQQLTQRFVAFLPDLLAAAVIFLVGWFVARVVRNILRNVLAAVGADALGERVGLRSDGPGEGLSGLIALIVYVLILIPVVISALNALALEAITAPASDMLSQLMAAVPGIIAALLVVGFAYFVGRLLSDVVKSLLQGAGFDGLLERAGVWRPQGIGRSASDLVGTLILAGALLFAAMEAASLLGLAALSGLIEDLAVFAAGVLLALVILAAGLYLSRIAQQAVSATGTPMAARLGWVVRVAILILSGAMALQQMNVGSQIIAIAFASMMGALAIAAALAFGLGGRQAAAEALARWSSGSGSSRPEGGGGAA